eukprot:gene47936-61662_t
MAGEVCPEGDTGVALLVVVVVIVPVFAASFPERWGGGRRGSAAPACPTAHRGGFSLAAMLSASRVGRGHGTARRRAARAIAALR